MKKFIISIFLIISFILSIFAARVYFKENIDKKDVSIKSETNKDVNDNKIEENEVEETLSEEKKVSNNANLIINKYYRDCSHTVTSNVDLPYEMVNMTEKEIKEKYSDWEVIDFDEKQVSLYREFDGICSEHYEVGIKNGYIAVYNLDEKKEKSLYELTDISTKFLPEGDINDLKKGIQIVGQLELNAFLEDYE